MCFYIHPKHNKMKIAKRNITCYKTTYKEMGSYRARYRDAIYKLGGLYKTKKFIKRKGVITLGRHSYSTPRFTYSLVTLKCIIPRGTKYYYNPRSEEYVSLAIKIIKEIAE